MRPRTPEDRAGCRGSAGSQPSGPRLPRTRALLLGLLSAVLVAAWLPAPARAEEDNRVVAMEDGLERERGAGGGGGVRGGGELEASMRSSLLLHFQAALQEAEAVASPSGTQQGSAAGVAPPAAVTAFPDSSAVVGRVFQMTVPDKTEDGYLGDVVKVSPRFGLRGYDPPTPLPTQTVCTSVCLRDFAAE